MTAVFRCDGCGAILNDEAPRLALEVVNGPAEQPEPEEGVDWLPVVHMSIGFSGDHHFCSPSCLGGWAMDRALDEAGAK